MADINETAGEYDVSDRLLNDEHRHLHGLISRIREVALHRETQTADVLVEYLYRFLQLHFETEERILYQRSLPDISAHAAEHERLLDEVRAHIDHYRTRGKIDYAATR